jgi:hypothetical protein
MAGFYHFTRAAVIAFLFTLTISPCPAQNTPESPAANEQVRPEVSRQEWLERVQEATRRAKVAAVEHRIHPERYTPSAEEKARMASERVLNDDSLQPGDIVSTDKGLFVFRGIANHPPKSEDFVPLPNR